MYLAIREMRFAKARYALIATIMILVAFLVLFVTGLAQGLAYDNAASIQNMPATHFVMEQGSDHRFTRSQLEQSRLQAVEDIVGEEHTEPLGLRMTTVVPVDHVNKLDVTLFALNASGWLAPTTIEGSPLPDLTKDQVLVDQKLSEDGVMIGDQLVDQATGASWTVSGFVKNESFSHTPVVYLSGQTGEAYNAIAIKASDEQIKQLLTALPDLEVMTKSEAVSAIPGYKEEQGSLTMMIVFLYVISAFVLAVFFYVITIQKTSQFGILKAIGTRTSYLATSVASQVLLLSISSLIISALLVELCKALLPSSMPFQLALSSLLFTCVTFVLMSLAGSLFSVWKVAKIDALDAIGRTAA